MAKSTLRYFKWNEETRLQLIETLISVEKEQRLKLRTAQGLQQGDAAAAEAASVQYTLKGTWKEVASRLPPVFNAIDPDTRWSTCYSQFSRLQRKLVLMKCDRHDRYRNVMTGEQDLIMTEELCRKLEHYQDTYCLNQNENEEHSPKKSRPDNPDRPKPAARREGDIEKPSHGQKQRAQQQSKRNVAKRTFFNNEDFKPAPRPKMFKWNEAARLHVIYGVKMMENNLSNGGQIKSWKAIADGLPKDLFEGFDEERLAIIAKKQFSEMRRKYRILKYGPDDSGVQKQTRAMTPKILRELYEYEEGCHRLQPSKRYNRGHRKLNEVVESLSQSSSEQQMDMESSRNRYSESGPVDHGGEVEISDDGGRETEADGSDDRSRQSGSSAVAAAESDNDSDRNSKNSASAGGSREILESEDRYAGRRRMSAAVADSDSDGNSKNSESSCREVLESDDHGGRRQRLESSAAATDSDMDGNSKNSNSYSREVDVVGLESDDHSASTRQTGPSASTADSASEENTKNTEHSYDEVLESEDSDLGENFRNAPERASQDLDSQGRKEESSPVTTYSDSEQDPDDYTERNLIEESIRRQRGSSFSANSDHSHRTHSFEENYVNKRNHEQSPRLHYKRKKVPVYVLSSSESDSESDPENSGLNPTKSESPHEDLKRESPSADSNPGSDSRYLNLYGKPLRNQYDGNEHTANGRSSVDHDRDSQSEEEVAQDCSVQVQAAVCTDPEESNAHANVEPAACNDPDSEGNHKIVSESDSEKLNETGEFERKEESQLQTTRPKSSSAADSEPQSENPENGSERNDDQESRHRERNQAESAQHESESQTEAAANDQEFKDAESPPNNNDPEEQVEAPVDSDGPEDLDVDELRNGSNDISRSQESPHSKPTGSSADNESEDDTVRRTHRLPSKHCRRDRHRAHRSRKRARKSGQFKFPDLEIPSSRTKGATDSSADSEPEHADESKESPTERRVDRTLKRLDLEFSRLNWWTKHRLLPRGKELITGVIKSANIIHDTKLKKRPPGSAGLGEYHDVIGKCRQKRMGLVLKAEFQQVRLKLAEEMEKTTHAVIQEVLQSFRK